MARIITTSPTGEQLALDLFPTADPNTLAVWDRDTRSPVDVTMWLERRTKPGTKSTTEFRGAWLNGTRRVQASTWWPTRYRAIESLLHNVHMMHRRDEPAAPEVLDRRDVSALDLELTEGNTAAAQFVHRDGQLVGLVHRVGLGYWSAETTDGTRSTGAYSSRRAALEQLVRLIDAQARDAAAVAQLRAAPTEAEALEAVAETAPAVTEPEVLQSFTGATVPAEQPAAPLFEHFRAFVRADEQTGEVRHLKIVASNYSTGADWTLVDVDWTEVDAVALGAETVTDPTPWLETFGYTLGEHGWSQIVSIRQWTRGSYAADVVPPATLELPSPAEVYGAGLGKLADELVQLERSREVRISERRRMARAAAAAGQSQSWIAERLGITRQAVAKLLAE